MRRFLTTAMVSVLALSTAATAVAAQEPGRGEGNRAERRAELTPEQRAERQQRRAEATPEQRAAREQRRAEQPAQPAQERRAERDGPRQMAQRDDRQEARQQAQRQEAREQARRQENRQEARQQEYRQERQQLERREDRLEDRRQDFRQDQRQFNQRQERFDDRREAWREDRFTSYRRYFPTYRPATARYRIGYWTPPRGYAYRPYRVGQWVPYAYRAPVYWINDPYRYNLRPAPYGYRWHRVGNDAVLIAITSGLVAAAVGGLFY